MRIKREIWQGSTYLLAILGTIALILGFGRLSDDAASASLHIHITNAEENYFLEIEDIEGMLIGFVPEATDTNNRQHVWQLQLIEEKIAAHPFTHSVKAYADHKGNLSIQVVQKRPIARLISQKGNDRYLTAEGDLLPLSEKHSARVPLLIGIKLENLLLKDEPAVDKAGLLSLLHYLDTDEFWKAQITEIEWKDQVGIVLYPQVGKQYLELGYPEDLERKFEKLMMFYTRIAPLQGWNKYSRVNVSFDNQIVCE